MKLHPIFQDCCAKADVRYRLSSPFRRGQWLYATDGRIAVRCDYDSLDAIDVPIFDGDKANTPPVEDVMSELPPRVKPWRIPELPHPTIVNCARCRGEGCMECDDEGSDTDHGFDAIAFGDYWMGPHYATLLQKHNAVIYTPSKAFNPALFVVGEGVEGVVMPINHGYGDMRVLKAMRA